MLYLYARVVSNFDLGVFGGAVSSHGGVSSYRSHSGYFGDIFWIFLCLLFAQPYLFGAGVYSWPVFLVAHFYLCFWVRYRGLFYRHAVWKT